VEELGDKINHRLFLFFKYLGFLLLILCVIGLRSIVSTTGSLSLSTGCSSISLIWSSSIAGGPSFRYSVSAGWVRALTRCFPKPRTYFPITLFCNLCPILRTAFDPPINFPRPEPIVFNTLGTYFAPRDNKLANIIK
jgi:hypothetical protein